MLKQFKQDKLHDLIKKYRQETSNPNSLMTKALNDIKKELSDSDKEIKINALQKLIFLYLNYYDIQWASFSTLEILSTCGDKGKINAYLIGSLQFKNNKDFLQLIPNQIRSDLKKDNSINMNCALNFINSVMDYSIASELLKDIESILNLNINNVRKKVIIALTLCCEKFAKNNDFNYWDEYLIKLVSILEMENISNGIQICIISSIQRICKISPEHTITGFVGLMNYFNKCEINWNLIKIIDIFGMLFKFQPKFTKKKEFIKILSEQIIKTKSKSVEGELVKLIITNFNVENNPNSSELVNAAEERLKLLLFHKDSNLLVLSLKMLNSNLNKKNYLDDIFKIIENHNKNKQICIECINILKTITDNDNYVEIIEKIFTLTNFIDKESSDAIIEICSKNNYEILNENKDNLIWFIDILFKIGNNQYKKGISNIKKSIETEKKISNVLRDLSQRIESLRNDMIEKSLSNLIECIKYNLEIKDKNEKKNNDNNNEVENVYMEGLKKEIFEKNENGENKVFYNSDYLEVLFFIIGEYSNEVIKIIKEIMDNSEFFSQFLSNLNFIQFINCIIKLFLKNSTLINDNYDKIKKLTDEKKFTVDIELIDNLIYLNSILNANDKNKIKDDLFKEKMNPISDNAQELIKIPEGINLEECFYINEDELSVLNKKKKKEDKKNSESEKVKIDTSNYNPEQK